MNQNLIEKLNMLEWYDNFLKLRIKIEKNKPLSDIEIINIYQEGIIWCEKTRIQLSKKIIGG